MPRPGSVAWRCDSTFAMSGACATGQHEQCLTARSSDTLTYTLRRQFSNRRQSPTDSLRHDRAGGELRDHLRLPSHPRDIWTVTSKRSSEMASARVRERTKARQSAARKAGIRKPPRKTLHGKLLQLPSSPHATVKRRGQHGPVESSPASRPKQVKTRSLVNLQAAFFSTRLLPVHVDVCL